MRQVLFLFFVGLSFSGPAAQAAPPARALTVTYMNIEWFGRNAQDGRTPKIAKFFDDHALWADVMVFEEIVNIDLLRDGLLQGNYQCQSYQAPAKSHQHVVLCYKNKYSLVKASDDDNYTLEDVQMTTLRPAVHGILQDSDGHRLLQIVGIHLKAMPDKSPVRRQQVQMIADYLADRTDDEPALLVGDFNAYDDDQSAFAAIFGDTMAPVDLAEDYTFRNAKYRNKFDLGFVSPEIAAGITERVVGPCNGGTAAEVKQYNQDVSDHCPVNLTVRLPSN